MQRVSQRTRAVLLLVAIAVCTAIGLGGGCTKNANQRVATTQIFVNQATAADTPLDCVPDPDGNVLYYIASKGTDRAVFKVDADGKVTELFAGAPLVDARGISISSDGAVLYLADPAAPGGGALYSLDIMGGGTPEIVKGTEGTAPRAVDVLAGGKEDEIYLAGQSSGAAAVLKTVAGSGVSSVLVKGTPLSKPDGVAVTRNGVVYVSDAGTDPGKVYQLKNGTLTPLGGDVKLGAPAGISAVMDESSVLVSSLDPQKGTSQVLIINPLTGATKVYNGTINESTVSGGLHRAHYANLFGWAGKTYVYRVKVVLDQPSSTVAGPGD
jgi:sugar lactone lactonase YvrE